jgi:hypothetical protein
MFRADCVWSVVLSLVLLLLGIAGLKLLGLVIDVIRRALDPSLPPPAYPFGWNPPAGGRRCKSSRDSAGDHGAGLGARGAHLQLTT